MLPARECDCGYLQRRDGLLIRRAGMVASPEIRYISVRGTTTGEPCVSSADTVRAVQPGPLLTLRPSRAESAAHGSPGTVTPQLRSVLVVVSARRWSYVPGPTGRRSARRSARCRPREALLLGMCQHVALQFFHDQAADRRITWT